MIRAIRGRERHAVSVTAQTGNLIRDTTPAQLLRDMEKSPELRFSGRARTQMLLQEDPTLARELRGKPIFEGVGEKGVIAYEIRGNEVRYIQHGLPYDVPVNAVKAKGPVRSERPVRPASQFDSSEILWM